MDIIRAFKATDWLLPKRGPNPRQITKFRSSPPASAIKRLAFEYELDTVVRFLPEPRIIFRPYEAALSGDKGKPSCLLWMKYRGTEYSLRIAMSWLGFSEFEFDVNETSIALSIPKTLGSDDIRRIEALYFHSVPVRERSTSLKITGEN